MTHEPSRAEEIESEDAWLIVKRGLYYRPNSSGYTGVRENAGRYTEAKARASIVNPEISVVRLSEAPEFSANCAPDIARDYLLRDRDSLRARIDALESDRNDAQQLLQTTWSMREIANECGRAQMNEHALSARIAELEAGLRPFADAAANWSDVPGVVRYHDSYELWQSANHRVDYINVGMLRHAASLLAGKEAKGNGDV